MRGKALGEMQRSTTYITVSCNYTDISVQPKKRSMLMTIEIVDVI